MNREINDITDVKEFAAFLIGEGVAFHPDNNFNEYVNIETGEPTYSDEQAAERNKLMNRCFQVCEESGESIYEIMMGVYLKETGMDSLIGRDF